MGDYYNRYLAMLNSDQLNVGSLKSDLKSIQDLKDYSDLNSKPAYFDQNSIKLPFSISATPDLQDSRKTNYVFSQSSNNIPATTNAADFNQGAAKGFIDSMVNLFGLLGIDKNQSMPIIMNAITFENSLTSGLVDKQRDNGSSPEDLSSFNPYTTSMYSTMDVNEFYNKQSNLQLKQYVETMFPGLKQIQLTNPQALNTYNNIFSLGNFESLKDWMMLLQVFNNRELFSQQGVNATKEFDDNSQTFIISTLGSVDTTTNVGKSFMATQQYFLDDMSTLYGKIQVGSKVKNDVLTMTEKIRDAYIQRLNNNTWLSPQTKKAAVNKLEKMIINVGYQEGIPALTDYTSLNFSPNESIYDINKAINKYRQDVTLLSLKEKSERAGIQRASFERNAFYDPSSNSIAVDGAMLTAPFFSESQTVSQNYGGIGIVIGHEISHAFDPTGAQFDSNGIRSNWWTEADKEKFNDLSMKMDDEYNGIKMDWGTVNGKNTLSENVADNGGLSVALELAKQDPSYNAKEFFENWARSSRMSVDKFTEEMLMLDSHAPAPVRVNVAVQNQDDFYSTYDVKPGDPMYLAPQDRVSIW